MSTNTVLVDKQRELKEAITRGMENTIPAYFFNRVGDALQQVLRLNARPRWTVNGLVLAVALFLPGLFIAILTGEIREWGSLHWFYITLWWAGFLSPIVCHLNVVYNILPTIRDHLVDSIQDGNELERFSAWVKSLWSLRTWMIVNVVIGIPYLIVVVAAESLGLGKFIGYGMLVMNLLLALPFVSPFYIIFKILTLPRLLAGLRLNLIESDPANSEVIQRLMSMLNVYLYYVAGYVAFLTVVGIWRVTDWLIWANILLGWIPTTAQFIVNQVFIRRIIVSAKWRYLSRLQKAINELPGADWIQASDESITRINQLMDLHDRVNARRETTMNLNSWFNFLNQLLLPLLGLLLGNMDRVFNFITSGK